jgi:hypothetical protein
MKLVLKTAGVKIFATEIKRPHPEAILVIESGKEFECTEGELITLVQTGYFSAGEVDIVGQPLKKIKAVSFEHVEYSETKPAAPAVPAKPSVPVKG